jgi:hypothetical protein
MPGRSWRSRTLPDDFETFLKPKTDVTTRMRPYAQRSRQYMYTRGTVGEDSDFRYHSESERGVGERVEDEDDEGEEEGAAREVGSMKESG